MQCETNNERNVITPASYWEGTTGSFYFRLPSGKESAHLPVVKTASSLIQIACAGRTKAPVIKIYIVGSPGDMHAHCWENYSLFTVNSIKSFLLKLFLWQDANHANRESQYVRWTAKLVTSAVVSSEMIVTRRVWINYWSLAVSLFWQKLLNLVWCTSVCWDATRWQLKEP